MALLQRSLLFPLSLLALSLSGSSVATTTVTIEPDDTRSTLSHCGPDCDIAYTVVEVSWEPTVSTILAYGNANSVAWTKSVYSQFFEEYSPQIVSGNVATDWSAPDFTATCCDDAWYIKSGVTAQFETQTGDACESTKAVFTGRAVGTAQPALPTDLPFLAHDCEVSSTITKTILTRITIMAAAPNPPTGTADGQSTWWEDGSDIITILLSPTPTPFFTISKCEIPGSSCYWSVGTENLMWEQSTITISGNATELASQEAALSTSIDNTEDWVNATLGWGRGEQTATCCSESIWLDDVVTIDYGGYCPTTVLTGFNTILPVSIAYGFVNGAEADCHINIGGGIATTKTAIFIEKVSADVRPPSTIPTATKEPDTLPTSTSSAVTKGTEIIDTSSRTTPTTTPATTPTTTPRSTTPRVNPQTTPRRSTTAQAEPVQSPQSESPRPPNSGPVNSPTQGPVNPPNTQPNNPPNSQPNNPPNSQSNNPPNSQPNNPPNTQPNNPPNTQPNSPPNNTPNTGNSPPQRPTGSNNPPQNTAPPNENPSAPVIPGTLAPEPSFSTIFTSIPVVITTTDDSGSQTIVSTFTNTPISTAANVITTDGEGNTITTRVTFSNPSVTTVNVITTDDQGNVITTQMTFSNPSATAVNVITTDDQGNTITTRVPLPNPSSTAVDVLTTDDQGNTITTRVTFPNPSATATPGSQNPAVSGLTSRTTILTLTSRVGTGITVETKTSVVVEPTSGSETDTGGSEATGSPSKATPQKTFPFFALVVAGLLTYLINFF